MGQAPETVPTPSTHPPTSPPWRGVCQLLAGRHRVRLTVQGQVHELMEGRNDVQLNLLRLLGHEVCRLEQLSTGEGCSMSVVGGIIMNNVIAELENIHGALRYEVRRRHHCGCSRRCRGQLIVAFCHAVAVFVPRTKLCKTTRGRLVSACSSAVERASQATVLFQGCICAKQVAVQGNAFTDHQCISEELRAGSRAAEFRVVFDAILESYWLAGDAGTGDAMPKRRKSRSHSDSSPVAGSCLPYMDRMSSRNPVASLLI